jgi:Putative beta-barrel porin 2
VGLTFFGDVTGKTSVLTTVSALQQIYDQNKNLDSVLYQISGGPTWNPSELISAQILVGFQYLQYTLAQVNQPPPFLSQYTRSKDSFQNFFFMGNLNWRPTSLLTITLQPYRTIQQTVVLGNLFFTVTGVNLGASHTLTDDTTLTLNLGLEEDQFESASGSTTGGDRTDHLKNVAVGVKYRAVKWVGLGFQYIFEDRSSTQDQFEYQANTFMVSAQTLF